MMLLDTCAFLWLAQAHTHFSKAVLASLDTATAVYVSAITPFEIALKCKSGKLRLPLGAREWCMGIIRHHGLSEIALDSDICLHATELPPFHNDPCDRFIIATALLRRLPVVTADAHFQQYGVTTML